MYALPKNQDMQIIELMYNCLQPEVMTFDTYNLDILKLEKLECTVENTDEEQEFFLAFNELKTIKDNVTKQSDYPAKKIVLQRLTSAIRSASNRICENCGGQGLINASCNNPYAYDCKYCSGRGIL